jgi:hypothetical protein
MGRASILGYYYLLFKAKQSQTKPSQVKPSKAKQSQAKPSKAKQSQAKPSKAKQSKAKPSKAKQSQVSIQSQFQFQSRLSTIEFQLVPLILIRFPTSCTFVILLSENNCVYQKLTRQKQKRKLTDRN